MGLEGVLHSDALTRPLVSHGGFLSHKVEKLAVAII